MKHDVVRLVVVLGADLALVDAFVRRSNVLYNQTPFVHSLIVVNANASVWCERIQTYCQRMYIVVPLPRHLHRMRQITQLKFITTLWSV